MLLPSSITECTERGGDGDVSVRVIDERMGGGLLTTDCKVNELRHENLFPNFYIINLPSITGIQFIDGVGENIVNCV